MDGLFIGLVTKVHKEMGDIVNEFLLLTLITLTGLAACISLYAVTVKKDYSVLDWFFIMFALCFYYWQSPSSIEFVKVFGRPLAIIAYVVVIKHIITKVWGKNGG